MGICNTGLWSRFERDEGRTRHPKREIVLFLRAFINWRTGERARRQFKLHSARCTLVELIRVLEYLFRSSTNNSFFVYIYWTTANANFHVGFLISLYVHKWGFGKMMWLRKGYLKKKWCNNLRIICCLVFKVAWVNKRLSFTICFKFIGNESK